MHKSDSGDLQRTLGEVNGKLEMLLPALQSITDQNREIGEISNTVEAVKDSLEKFKSEVRNKLELGVNHFHALDTLTDNNKLELGTLKKKEDKRSSRIMNMLWDLIKLFLAAALGALCIYLIGGRA